MPQIFPCQNHTWRDLQPTRQVEGDWARSGSRILNIYINQAVDFLFENLFVFRLIGTGRNHLHDSSWASVLIGLPYSSTS